MHLFDGIIPPVFLNTLVYRNTVVPPKPNSIDVELEKLRLVSAYVDKWHWPFTGCMIVVVCFLHDAPHSLLPAHLNHCICFCQQEFARFYLTRDETDNQAIEKRPVVSLGGSHVSSGRHICICLYFLMDNLRLRSDSSVRSELLDQ